MLFKMFISLLSIISGTALASGYPSNYCDQSVASITNGPALFVHVSSGCISKDVWGYKLTGPLAAQNPESITAVVTASCVLRGTTLTKQTLIELGREWHGAGYLSEAFNSSSLPPSGCYAQVITIGVAFSANDRWDSLDGKNYPFSSRMFYDNTLPIVSQATHEGSDDGKINLKAWEIIVSELQK